MQQREQSQNHTDYMLSKIKWQVVSTNLKLWTGGDQWLKLQNLCDISIQQEKEEGKNGASDIPKNTKLED